MGLFFPFFKTKMFGMKWVLGREPASYVVVVGGGGGGGKPPAQGGRLSHRAAPCTPGSPGANPGEHQHRGQPRGAPIGANQGANPEENLLYIEANPGEHL